MSPQPAVSVGVSFPPIAIAFNKFLLDPGILVTWVLVAHDLDGRLERRFWDSMSLELKLPFKSPPVVWVKGLIVF